MAAAVAAEPAAVARVVTVETPCSRACSVQREPRAVVALAGVEPVVKGLGTTPGNSQ